MSDATSMGRTIREARLARGMSLSQLASAVGRSSSSVRRWERGEVPPAIGIIDDLADALQIDPEELRALRPGATPGAGSTPPPVDGGVHSGVGSGRAPDDRLDLDRVPVVAPPPEPLAETRRPAGFFTDVVEVLRSATESWSGWIRGAMTALVLLIMAVVLIWVLGQLASAMAEIWDSFDAGS